MIKGDFLQLAQEYDMKQDQGVAYGIVEGYARLSVMVSKVAVMTRSASFLVRPALAATAAMSSVFVIFNYLFSKLWYFTLTYFVGNCKSFYEISPKKVQIFRNYKCKRSAIF